MRSALKTIGSGIKNFMIIFSFIVNLVLLIVVVVLGLLLFDIKNNIAEPLVMGLHSSFVGLDESTIDWTIPVRDTIPVVLDIPLETDTVVTLTEPVPLTVNAVINLPGVGTLNNAVVNLQLPAGLELPVHLDLNVPVNEDLDVSLDVRAVIPLRETQLHDAIDNLRLLFEPLTRGLYNLPDNFEEAGPFVTNILAGNMPDLMAENAYSRDPWPGFSRTAGLGYQLGTEQVPPENRPLETGLVPVGGIAALDEIIRPEVYDAGGPMALNAERNQELQQMGIPPAYYNGSYAQEVYAAQQGDVAQSPSDMGLQPVDSGQPAAPPAENTAPIDPNAGQSVIVPPADTAPLPADANTALPPVDTASQPAESGVMPPEAAAAPVFEEQSAEGDLGILPSGGS